MKLVFSCDPNAEDLKLLMEHARKLGHEVADLSSEAQFMPAWHSNLVSSGDWRYEHGVLLCGTGIGVSIAANGVEVSFARF